jgi:hypothetical protein
MTIADRAERYAESCIGRSYPDSIPTVSRSGRWITGMWLLGHAYQGSGYYGAYPPSYLGRIAALFPDVPPPSWVHLFSGSLSPDVPGLRIDRRLTADVRPSVVSDSCALPLRDGSVRFVCADPPYSTQDSARYGTGAVRKPAVLREIARVVRHGGHLVWLDTTLPMYRRAEWHLWGLICVQRSTNHRTRLCSIFTRVHQEAGRMSGLR